MNDPTNPFEGIDWGVSVLGAVALSILANLLTSPVQNFLAKFNKQRSRKRIEKLKQQVALIESYVKLPSVLYSFVLHLAFKIVFVTLVAFAVGDVFAAAVTASRFRFPIIPDLFYPVGQVLTALLYLTGVNFTLSGLRVLNQVRNFETYRDEIEKMMLSLGGVQSHTEDSLGIGTFSSGGHLTQSTRSSEEESK